MALGLMYHNFVPAEADKGRLPAEHRRYTLTEAEFVAHIDAAARLGWRFLRPDDVLHRDKLAGKAILLTFDDSWREHEWAAEVLAKRGLSGVFFLNSGLLGEAGMLDEAAVRRMADRGQEIGSHGVTHAFLNSLDTQALERALVDSKAALTRACGRETRFLSLPGGRCDERLEAAARRAGYLGVFTSRPGYLRSVQDKFLLNRLPITADITVQWFRAVLRAPLPAIALGRLLYDVASLTRMSERGNRGAKT